MDLLLLLAQIALKSAAIVGVGFLLSLMMRRQSANWRNWIWRGALLGTIAIPFAVSGGRLAAENTDAPILKSSFLTPPPAAPAYHQTTAIFPPKGSTPTPPRFSVAELTLAAYGIGCVVASIRLVASLLLAKKLVDGSTPCLDSRWGIRRGIGARTVPGVSAPATVGLKNPVILLPEDAPHWPEERMKAAVLHEWAHIQRSDWSWQLVAHVVAVFQWFNPAVWFLFRQLRLSAEFAADERALDLGLDKVAYARELLNIAASVLRSNQTAVTMARPGGVSDRFQEILSNQGPRRDPAKPLQYALGLTFGFAILVAGALASRIDIGVASYGPGAPFYGPIALKNGDQVRVEFLQDWSVEPNLLWQPDGSAATSRQVRESLKVPVPTHADPLKNRVYIKISKTGERCPADWAIRVPFKTSVANYMSYGLSYDGPQMDMATLKIPENLTQTDIKVGIATGKWRKLTEVGLGEPFLHARIVPQTFEGCWQMWCGEKAPPDQPEPKAEPASAANQTPKTPIGIAGNSNANTTYLAITVPPEYQDKRLFMQAFTDEGQIGLELSQIDSSGSGRLADDCDVFQFNGNGRPITRLVLWGRDYEWLTFRGIRVRPN